jgi:hypothetical protein
VAHAVSMFLSCLNAHIVVMITLTVATGDADIRQNNLLPSDNSVPPTRGYPKVSGLSQ